MNKFNLDKPAKIYFIGIGGISMSGLARILCSRGFDVSGSDLRKSNVTDSLQESGVTIFIPQDEKNITSDIEMVVYTAAIHPDNPEYKKCIELNIPMISRADLLGNIMEHYSRSIAISGTHGKTTTTSMISHILLEGTEEPTISIGGILRAINSNIHVGSSDIFVTEACEYTNSFLSFYPKYSVILNIEEDHLDFFKDINDIRNSFSKFASNTKEGGTIVIANDIQNKEDIYKSLSCDVCTFGMDSTADCYPKNIGYENGCGTFDAVYKGETIGTIALHVPGEHNIKNALASICVAKLMNISTEQIQKGFESFTGADRRFQHKGFFGDIEVIDDYAHHPSEIDATIKAARRYSNKHLTVAFQPHTYTRTKALLPDFIKTLSQADTIVLAEIYPARETDTLGMSSKLISDALKDMGKEAYFFPTFDEVKKFLQKNCTHPGLLITMGAGNIYTVGEALVEK